MGKSILRIFGVCGAVAVMLWVVYVFLARSIAHQQGPLRGKPLTALERARLQAQVQRTMKLLEEQQRLQGQWRLGQPSVIGQPLGTAMPGHSEPLKALKTIEDINRINRFNREAHPLTPQPTHPPQSPTVQPSPSKPSSAPSAH